MKKPYAHYLDFCFTLLFTLSVVTPADAETASDKSLAVLPPVVVTATKVEVPLRETAASTTVIDGRTLEEKHTNTVLDALRAVPGLHVVQNGGPGSATSVFIRGAKSEHTLVLIDGVQVNSPTLGLYNFANLTTDNIERIEIIRGPQSTLYGSDAIGGVIHIITKKGSGPFSGSASFEGGAFDSFKEEVQLNGAAGHFDYSFSAARFDTEGFSKANAAAGNTEEDAYGNTTVSSRLGLNFTQDARLDWSLRFSDAKVNLDNSFPVMDDLNASQENESLSTALILVTPVIENWSQKLQGHFQQEESVGKDPDTAFNNFKIKTRVEEVDWQHTINFGEHTNFSLGYAYEQQAGENVGTFDKRLRTQAHYGFYQTQLAALILNLGLRHDDNNQFGGKTTYKTEAAFLIDDEGSKIRGAYGTGFHGPTLNDLYFPGFGNPNLKPEESESLEVGFDLNRMDGRLNFSASYFQTQIEQLIVFVFDPNTFLGMPENVEKAKISGWEIGATVEITKRVQLSGEYTFTDTQNETTGAELARRPKHKASATLTLKPIDPLRIDFGLLHVGKRFNDTANTNLMGDYTVFKLSGNIDIKKNIQIFARIENLFDRHYEEVAGFGTAGLSAYGGLKISF